jgi:geranylgeranyl diphosphate synthase type II
MMNNIFSKEKDVKEILEKYQILTRKIIDDFLPRRHDIPEIDLLYKMIRDYPSRMAKGLRSTMCMLTCEAFGGDLNLSIISAAALELFQNWILIHDDVEDYSELRRGEPVLHRKYGFPQAINAGDALHGKMWELITENVKVIGEKKTISILSEFHQMINETTEGQHMELIWIDKNCWNINENDYYTMVKKKTAWYTCVTPCRIGAKIAGANDHQLDMIIDFGLNLGIGFQIRDDILNLEEEGDKYGKERYGDLWEGKRTLMMIRLMDVCRNTDKKKLIKIMKKKRQDKTTSEIEYIIQLIKKSDAIEYARTKSSSLGNSSKNLFDLIFSNLPNSKAKGDLSIITDYMVSRNW